MRKCPLAFFVYICTYKTNTKPTNDMKLSFHPITLADKALVQRYTNLSNRRNCDLSFANLYGWQFLYQTEIAEWGGFLLFRFSMDEHLTYLLPAGQGDWATCMHVLRDDACRQNKPLLLSGVPRELLPSLQQICGIDFITNENRDHADYIYLRQSLATLAGKKLQSKRNHVNKFRKLYPDYTYRPLTKDLVPMCLQLAEQWADSKTEESARRGVSSELTTIRRVLEHMDELDIIGGTLFVNGRMAAFTYGALITPDTFDVCVEKADVTIEGAYAAINCEFAGHLPETIVYLNREEDLGIEGLRKAKLSYQPHELLEKFNLWSACTVVRPSGERETTCRQSHIRWQTRALWKLCFNDNESFVRLYFSKVYRHELNSFEERDGKVIAALQRLPYRLTLAGHTVTVGYVSGVCTSPEFRGKGIMNKLMKQAHRQMAEDGHSFALLIPAEERLFDYYAKQGYAPCRPSLYEQTYEPLPILSDNDPQTDDTYTYQVITKKEECEVNALTICLEKELSSRGCAVVHTKKQIDVVLDDLFLANGIVVTACSANGKLEAVLLAVNQKGALHIMEIAAPDRRIVSTLVKRAADTLQPEQPQITRTWNRAALRILNVPVALSLYADVHPELNTVWRIIGDDALLDNNGFYRLANGTCTHLPQPACCTESLSSDAVFDIRQLAERLFNETGPYLSLMLN